MILRVIPFDFTLMKIKDKKQSIKFYQKNLNI